MEHINYQDDVLEIISSNENLDLIHNRLLEQIQGEEVIIFESITSHIVIYNRNTCKQIRFTRYDNVDVILGYVDFFKSY